MASGKIKPILILSLIGLLTQGCLENNLGLFQQSLDIGNPAIQGSSSYDQMERKYTLKGSGYNIWFERDEFHYLFRAERGDFVIKTELGFTGEGKDPHRKIGIMVREDVADNAAHISGTLHGDGLTVLQWRTKKGMPMRDPEDEIFAPESHYQFLMLERKGNEFILKGALEKEGEYQLIGAQTMPDMDKKVFLGIFICSHEPQTLEEAWFANVEIE
ncbi:MAG: hypothetical protein R6V72_05320 [Cyclobacterium sp.]|uniref:hypothetical protein n=1 Tax=unclassified Cyclobacterium TaxID=2615055 RepID=UPI0013D6CB1D|nr:hypothetical protein [Cyclobacterium sp. SYSU L10401]